MGNKKGNQSLGDQFHQQKLDSMLFGPFFGIPPPGSFKGYSSVELVSQYSQNGDKLLML